METTVSFGFDQQKTKVIDMKSAANRAGKRKCG